MTEATEVRTKSADDLIVSEEARKLGQPLPATENKPEAVELQPEKEDAAADSELASAEATEETAEEPVESKATEDTPSSDENVDAYGNPVAAKKTYTEEEVQAMIRKRLKERHTEQPAAVQQATQDFKADPESEDSWEKQLGDFVERKLEDLSVKKQQKAWQEQEAQSQADFESKFSTGMTKYNDFENVVGGKPITTGMMMATRSMADPAAFLYAACKQQPAEIERIAKLADPYAQVAEIARLEERMKKARVISAAPRPAKRISGDATNDMPKVSIDQLINSHAKSKIMERRK